MTLLIIGIAVFLGIHLLPSFPQFRAGFVERIGETGYRSSSPSCPLPVSCCSSGASRRPRSIQVWSPPPWTRWVAIVLMLPAFIFLVAAYVPCRLKARLKHPFLAAIKTWALAHLIANGDLASITLFGSFLAYAVYDRIALKGRKPTALVETPGSGPARNDLIAVVLGVIFYVVFLVWLHPLLIGRVVIQH
ncbi:NnrU family protein [Methyloceanibacter superfactus]|uniref:NnrU family protein n=1 Tax=Methyloceanibacter superfactus TaxID=1774969 RepID=UPI0008499111|nr:NnrU family protein [Methyloceanibacter superfactus]